MSIKKVPKNYDTTLNRRKQHLNEVIDALNNVTDVIANPDGTATEELENLQIGDTIYSVNKPTFEFIKALRLTIANGGEYRTDKPKIEFYDDGGNVRTIAANEYTATCDKSYAGNINIDNVCSVATSDAPGIFTYTFNNDLEVSNYHLIKLTNAGAFVGDIAKNIKLELSSNGTDFITLWEDPAIVWTTATPYRIIDIKTGNVSDTLLPIVTTADNGKVLGVVNGKWDKSNITRYCYVIPITIAGTNVMISRYTVSNIVEYINSIATTAPQLCVLRTVGSGYKEFHFSGYEYDDDITYAVFNRISRSTSATTYEKIKFDISSTSNRGTIETYTVND